MEQTDTLLDKDHTQLLSGLKDRAVVLATSGGSNILDARSGGTEDVVNEGELTESVSLAWSGKKANKEASDLGKNLRKRQTKQPPHPASAARPRALPE